MTQEDSIRRMAKIVDRLKERIKKHGRYLRGRGGKELRTRVLLIDPLLRALDWDLENPDQVEVEVKREEGTPDYTLIKDGLPVALIEAKGLGENLNAKDPGQVIRYTTDPNFQRVSVVVFTNGDEWLFFRQSERWKSESVKITSSESALTAVALVNRLDRSGLSHRQSTAVKPAMVGNDQAGGNWYPLDGVMPRDRQPTGIRFGDGNTKPVKYWYHLLKEVALHLISTGSLNPGMAPVSFRGRGNYRGYRYLINTSPLYEDGKPFERKKRLAPGLWYDSNGGADGIPPKSVGLMEAVGADPSTVQVRFD